MNARTMKDQHAPVRFLQTAFQVDDWVAILVKSSRSGRVGQRVMPLTFAVSSRIQEWLWRENEAGGSVYVTVNAVKPSQTSRGRSAIGSIRHVFLDVDKNGAEVVSAIAARRDLPSPSYLIHSSPNRVHVLWRAREFTCTQVERLQKHLSRELGADRAATACSQLTRMPAFLNQKYRPAVRVEVEYLDGGRTYTPSDFPVGGLTASSPVQSIGVQPCGPEQRAVSRAARYVAAAPPAIAGQHGDVQTFRLCCRVVRGFALSHGEAMRILADWNARCQPPWSERELAEKIRRARRYGREPVGGLLERTV